MIELVVSARCTGCNACVEACPTNVFDAGPGRLPVIARREDCQTCYMCELYCPEDALFVGSDAERAEGHSEAQLLASGLLGQFRRDHGWGEWADDPRYQNQHWYMGEVFRRARAEAAAPRQLPRPAEERGDHDGQEATEARSNSDRSGHDPERLARP